MTPPHPTQSPRTDAAALAQEAVLNEFRAAGALLEGHFLLSSGLRSSVYLQCAKVMQDPLRGGRLCGALAAKVLSEQGATFDLCVSPAMGAVIVGYETAKQLGVNSIFMERPEGGFELRRGFEMAAGARCLMVEDVVTTGKSSRECIAAIRAAGGEAVGAACLLDRSGGTADLGVPLTPLVQIEAPLFDPDNLPPELAAIPPVKPGSRRA